MYKTKQELITYLEFIGSFLVTYLNWFTMISSIESREKENWILYSALTNFFIHFILFMATSSFHYLQINPLVTTTLWILKKIKITKAAGILKAQLLGIAAGFLLSVVQTGTYKILRNNARETLFYFIFEINPNPDGNRMSFGGRICLMSVMTFMNMFIHFVCFSKSKENKVRYSLAISLFYLCTIGTFKLRIFVCFNQLVFFPYALISGLVGFDYIILYFVVPILFSLLGGYFVKHNFRNLLEHGDSQKVSANYDMLEPKPISMEI